MRFRTRPRINELAAVVSILSPRLGRSFSAEDLVRAIEAYNPDGTDQVTDRLLSVPEFARQINVSTRTAYYMLADGEFAAVMVRGKLRVRQSYVQKILEEGTPRPARAAKEGAAT